MSNKTNAKTATEKTATVPDINALTETIATSKRLAKMPLWHAVASARPAVVEYEQAVTMVKAAGIDGTAATDWITGLPIGPTKIVHVSATAKTIANTSKAKQNTLARAGALASAQGKAAKAVKAAMLAVNGANTAQESDAVQACAKLASLISRANETAAIVCAFAPKSEAGAMLSTSLGTIVDLVETLKTDMPTENTEEE